MTNRDRLLAILSGRSPDRIPWIPRLQLWYNARQAEGTLPARFQGMTLREVEHALNVMPLSLIDRIERISELVETYGNYPTSDVWGVARGQPAGSTKDGEGTHAH